MFLCASVRMYVRVCVLLHNSAIVFVLISMCLCINVYVCVFICVYMGVCVHVFFKTKLHQCCFNLEISDYVRACAWASVHASVYLRVYTCFLILILISRCVSATVYVFVCVCVCVRIRNTIISVCWHEYVIRWKWCPVSKRQFINHIQKSISFQGEYCN